MATFGEMHTVREKAVATYCKAHAALVWMHWGKQRKPSFRQASGARHDMNCTSRRKARGSANSAIQLGSSEWRGKMTRMLSVEEPKEVYPHLFKEILFPAVFWATNLKKLIAYDTEWKRDVKHLVIAIKMETISTLTLKHPILSKRRICVPTMIVAIKSD